MRSQLYASVVLSLDRCGNSLCGRLCVLLRSVLAVCCGLQTDVAMGWFLWCSVCTSRHHIGDAIGSNTKREMSKEISKEDD